MDHNDKVRNEPTLADLEAFERLLRDSLKNDRPGSVPPATHADLPPVFAAPPLSAPTRIVPQDGSAFDELTRLIEQPLSFDMPTIVATPTGSRPEPLEAPALPPMEWDEVGAQAAMPVADERTVYIPQPAPGEPDPLMVFESELRAFDAMKTSSPDLASHPDLGLRSDFAGSEHYAQPPLQGAQGHHAGAGDPQQPDWNAHPYAVPAAHAPARTDSLSAAEDRLAAESAAVAASEAPAGVGRSRTIFFGLGGIAIAGLAAIGATFALGGKRVDAPKTVPVIAAKQEPTKEKPVNPGGIEIPDQNKQVLAPKTLPVDTKPAQVVNTTEQPVDLNQATKREAVRVVAPSPFPAPAPAAAEPAPAAPAVTPAASEPRRVQSVKLSDPMLPTPRATTPSLPSAGTGAAALPNAGTAAAALAGSAAIAAIAGASAPKPVPTITPAAAAPKAAVPPARTPAPAVAAATPTTPAAPKAESRPVTATQAPRPTTPAVAPARPANAPISLVNPAPRTATAPVARPAAAPAGGAGGFAVQLASRPTIEDARGASTQLGARYSGALAGKGTSVVSGQANGKTVYRIRANGYSQADANAACERVKAAGGSCFVTRQ